MYKYIYTFTNTFIHVRIYQNTYIYTYLLTNMYEYTYPYTYILTHHLDLWTCCYGVATISRLLKITGLFCKRALQKRPVFCKETCIFKHPTHRSHPISPPALGQNPYVFLYALICI